MKEHLIAFLLSLSCALTVSAVACADNQQSSNDTDSSSSAPEYTGTRKVTLEEGVGFTYVTDVESGADVEAGSNLTFKVEKGGFYQDSNPTVYVNDIPVAHDGTGLYTVKVTEDLTIRVEGMRRDVSNMDGTGTMDSPFIVTKPVDLLYIAEQVNKGNVSYVQGSYILANDIDCKGETLKVIGDMSTENAYFSGCFTCNYDETTGIPLEYSISNFKIDSSNSNYVGLFGAVFCDLSVTSSGLFYGIRLDNYTIEARYDDATAASRSLFCGSLVGYGVGVNALLCHATNGEINIAADDSYFAYAGGLIGYQQAFYNAAYDYYFPSEIAYATVDVDVNVLKGMALYAGGISGFLSTNTAMMANASIHNSYATGSVSGALRAGGIAGGVGQHNVVSNCYASGDIVARSTQTITAINPSDEYCYAYAGGLVGYAENDAIAHDSFFNGNVYANAAQGKSYAFTDTAIGGGDVAGTASASANKYTALNCLANVELSDPEIFTEKLGWGAYDWVFTADELPVINYEPSSVSTQLYLNLEYVAPHHDGEEIKVRGAATRTEKYFDSSTQNTSSYASIGGYFLSGDLPLSTIADNGFLSYGYFFDKECTQPVPYGYMPMKTVTLYVAFEDPTEVVGTYELITKDAQSLQITFNKNGSATYTDGATEGTASYSYDGERIYLEGARLARYYDGEIVVDETNTSVVADANFELARYQGYNFVGVLEDGVLSLYDGTYFTKDAPLTAMANAIRGEYFVKDTDGVTYYVLYGDKATVEIDKDEYSFVEYDECVLENGVLTLLDSSGFYDAHVVNVADLTKYDAFKGVWNKSAKVHKYLTFDGMGGFKYELFEYEYGYNSSESATEMEEGAYVDNGDGSISFTLNGKNYHASFNVDGFLEIKSGDVKELYAQTVSNLGQWSANGLTLTLNGIQANGLGSALYALDDGTKYELVYEASQTEGYAVLYLSSNGNKGDFFGYCALDKANNVLTATLSDPNNAETGYTQYQLYLYDDYKGEWITSASGLENVEFIFDGNGLYSHLGINGSVTVIENNEETTLSYALDSLQNGKIVYKGVEYILSFDELSGSVSISATDSLQRKDEFAGETFIDLSGNEYVFDGRSTLGEGSIQVNGEKTYLYTANGESFNVFDLDGNSVGAIEKTQRYYSLTANGASVELYLSNQFMGKWAMANEFQLFTVGPTDLTGVTKASFKGNAVEMTEYDNNVLTFSFIDRDYMGMPRTYYLFIVFDESVQDYVVALTEYDNLYGGDMIICSKVSELYGTWTSVADPNASLTFDGVKSAYANGTAKHTWKGYDTLYSYNFNEYGVMMWSQATMQDAYWYYKIELKTLDEYPEAYTDKNAWINEENGTVIIRTQVDSLFRTVAVDENGKQVFFNGNHEIWIDGVLAYTYKSADVVYNTDNTISIKAVSVADGKTYNLVIDHNEAEFKFIVKGEVSAE